MDKRANFENFQIKNTFSYNGSTEKHSAFIFSALTTLKKEFLPGLL